ncbi:transmembrane protein 45A-like [Antedon mediterranea]|uniref:transmembrane protein 45A-like n=1 Tax=Antedon mediterranea TaxID=105859 RepID=UPI003AF79B78
MGSFPGHAMSGISFLALATFWTIQQTFNPTYASYQRTGRRGDRMLQRLKRLPVEGTVVFVIGVIGIIGEQVYKTWKWRLFDDHGVVVYSDVWQHCTMYAVFAIYGVSKIAVGTYLKGAERWTKVFLTFAYFVECMLFYFHLHGRTELNIRLHTLEVLAVFMCVLFSAGEIWFPRDDVLPWLRTWATFLQGTWMLQVGSTLYHPLRNDDYSWDEDDHLNVKFFSMIFAWHCILGIVVVTLQIILIKTTMRCVFGALPSSYTGLNGDAEENHLVFIGGRNNTSDEECQIFSQEILTSEEEG